jgi:hypothetical protein
MVPHVGVASGRAWSGPAEMLRCHEIRGWIGRRREGTDGPDGEVPSRGAASWCRGVGHDKVPRAG